MFLFQVTAPKPLVIDTSIGVDGLICRAMLLGNLISYLLLVLFGVCLMVFRFDLSSIFIIGCVIHGTARE